MGSQWSQREALPHHNATDKRPNRCLEVEVESEGPHKVCNLPVHAQFEAPHFVTNKFDNHYYLETGYIILLFL